jgi:hypothetical protein
VREARSMRQLEAPDTEREPDVRRCTQARYGWGAIAGMVGIAFCPSWLAGAGSDSFVA